jgi:3-phosphoshikimate 1-carboxyvinyltransferase
VSTARSSYEKPVSPGETSIDLEHTVALSGPGRVAGTLTVPGDKSISHRALLLAGLAEGTSTVTGLSKGDDVSRTRRGLERLGVGFQRTGDGWSIRGGLRREPDEPLDLGNSGTAMRLFTGVCSGLDAFTVLTGDQYLRARPMARVAEPLRAMGARIDGRLAGSLAPLAVRGGSLTGIDYTSPVASAQVKSAILLAGLSARGRTTVREQTATRRHTEEMLADFGGSVFIDGTAVTMEPRRLTATTVRVPGDPSQAAFWAVAGAVCPDSAVTIEGLYLGYGRAGFVGVLRRMGARVETDPAAGALHAQSGQLRGVQIGPDEIPGIVDEVPVLAVAAAFAEGTTVISGAQELRVKESDRIKSTVAMLRAFGGAVQETPDGMVIEGGRLLSGGVVDCCGDHRIAMAACVCGLATKGTTIIRGWESVATSYPGFADDVRLLSDGTVSLRAEAG